MQIVSHCDICGNEFTADRRTQKRCSEKCRTVYRARFAMLHKDKVLEAQRRFASKPETKAYRANWHRVNRPKLMARIQERIRANPELRIRRNLRQRMNQFINGQRRVGCTHDYIGCSCADLKAHIESKFKPGMSWSNYGVKGWHIDHIKPMTAFKFVNPDGSFNESEMRAAMHYTNLQPLWAEENISKRNKILT